MFSAARDIWCSLQVRNFIKFSSMLLLDLLRACIIRLYWNSLIGSPDTSRLPWSWMFRAERNCMQSGEWEYSQVIVCRKPIIIEVKEGLSFHYFPSFSLCKFQKKLLIQLHIPGYGILMLHWTTENQLLQIFFYCF